ncbi:GNAT family N-acetyltransferase [uncultured Jatrophihabitans sp.]|uniref:GNAT family N-acetyltransferase n=1 Tax=uncultured Jatrophihabitans sp. TaxID=1610747 RepID=UPI0035CC8810
MSTLLDRPVRRGAGPWRVDELDDADRAELIAFVDRDPIVNAVVAGRLHTLLSLSARRFGGQLLGVRDAHGRLAAAAFNGGNLLPMGGQPEHWLALAEFVARRPRVCSSVVGHADTVAVMWPVLEAAWGAPRAVRRRQPLLALDRAVADRPADVGLRAVRRDELDAYLPAAAAMFAEELGVSPHEGGTGHYRSRVAALIREGRAFGVVRGGEVVFKADFGAVSPRTCQIQGVWTRPDLRGQGLGTAAMVGVLDRALALAPSASLYVNDFNEPARRMYARLGMRDIAVLSTVLL